MGGEGDGARLRQAVLVAATLEPVAARLRSELGLGEPFRDPGVSLFGLENAVFAVGDCFLEVVSPLQAGLSTAAGRELARRGGDGGYMVMFDVRELEGARARAAALGVRTVWEIDLPDISASHLHPADVGGAIVSIDQPQPPGSWRWGGPAWTGARGPGAPGLDLVGVTVAVPEPDRVARRWAEILGVELAHDDGFALSLSAGGRVTFVPVDADAPARGLVAIDLALDSGAPAREIEIGGVLLRLRSTSSATARRS